MSRRQDITDQWPALHVEGGLINPAMLARIAAAEAPEQEPADYGLRKGLRLQDEISIAYRVGHAHYQAFREQPAEADATRHFIANLLREAFGFDDLQPADFPLSLIAGEDRVPVITVPPSEDLDKRSHTLSIQRARTPTFALQDYLNEREEALWGILSNGRRLRLLRDNHSLTRPAWLEADLEQIFDNEDYASFSLLWLLLHRSRFGKAGAPAPDCALERWREAGMREGVAARDRLAAQVEEALKVLGTGFLQANPQLTARLQSGEMALIDWFNELLRLVYRLIFLMVAEDRDLLHPRKSRAEARELYARGYSLAMLRQLCTRRSAWDHHHDRYEGLKIVFAALARGEERLALPALGGLFAPDQLPTLQDARLPNRALMEALYRLSWLQEKGGRMPVNWRAMETEELGSVYESLLELQPQLADEGRALTFASTAVEKKGHQRKTTGSYYTPDSLVQALLDTALDPVLERAEAADDPERALLNLKVIDPACGSGHFLLAAARRLAARLARIRAGQELFTRDDLQHALRAVARNCIYGVDRNPMAVELTRVALWIETVEPGRPLGFFDANIRCGDSLLGVLDLQVLEDGIPDAAYKALTGDDKEVAKYYQAKNRKERKEKQRIDSGFSFGEQRDLTRALRRLRAMPEKTLPDVERKKQALEALRAQGGDWWRLQTACDLYVAAFLLPKRKGGPHANPLTGMPERGKETVPTSGSLWRWLKGEIIFGPQVGEATEAARAARAFHWPLEFADIMASGGFDVVLGNPPWDVMQLSDKEYFASRIPEIAALAGAARKGAIAELQKSNPDAYQEFVSSKRLFDAVNEFARSSGRFNLTTKGKLNTYALFAELFLQLSRQRAGIIVPTGIATDATTAPFFAHLVQQQRLASLFDFENRQAIFPSVHRSYKFCLLTLGRDVPQARFAFFLQDVAELADERRIFTLTPRQIAAINPNTRTAPVFRSRKDAELTAKIYARVPVLIDESRGAEGNPWGVEFRQGLFNMTSDSHLFRTAEQLRQQGFVRQGTDWVRPAGSGGALPLSGGANAGELALPDGGPRPAERYVPLYEAKMIHQFDHRWATYDDAGEKSRDVSLEEKQNPTFEPQPRYWVPQREVETRLAAKGWKHPWLMGWRDIARATDERTVIATIFPRVGVGHVLPLFFLSAGLHHWPCFCGNMNVLVLDFVARQKVGGTHLTYGYLKQFPILPPSFYTDARLAFIVPRVLELSYTSWGLWGLGFGIWEDADGALRGEILRRWLKAWGNDGHTFIQRFARLAAGHGSGRGGLSADEVLATSRALWADITSASGSQRHSGGHCRGTRSRPDGSIHSISADSAGGAEGAGDAPVSGATGGTAATGGADIHAGADREPGPATGRPDPQALHEASFQILIPTPQFPLPPFRWDEERRALLRAELDAFYARAYGLTRDELRYILDPADVMGADYPSETFRVLKEKEQKQYGEYRTRRLVLEAWDRMEQTGTFASLGL